MNDRDTDWLIYHLAARSPTVTPADLVAGSGLDPSTVGRSLERLERNLLIEQRDGMVRVLAIHESLLLCQIRHAKDLSFTVEDGVIKERRG